MSSALAKLSQIPVRSKFLIVLRNISGDQFNPSDAPAFTLDEGQVWGVGTVGTIMEEAALNVDGIATAVDVTQGRLYRDLGRQVMVVDDATGAHLALFREAIRQNGVGSEGPADATGATVWLCVWRADGNRVGVARTA